MILEVRAVPGAGRVLVREENSRLKVYLNKPAEDGCANSQLIEVLAGYFGVKKYQIKIVKGHRSRNKIIKIDDSGSHK